MEEEGYIETATSGMRLFGPITTKHVVAAGLGVAAFSPFTILLILVGLTVPGPRVLILIYAAVGLLPGSIIGAWPIKKRNITLIVWLYRKIRFRLRTNIYVWDREFRERKNRAVITAWMREIEEVTRHQQQTEGARES